MKTDRSSRIVGVREAKMHLSEYIKRSRKAPVVITSHGKPEAVLVNVAGMDPEDVILFTSPEFQSALNYRETDLVSSQDVLKRYSIKSRPLRPPGSAAKKKTRTNIR